jgi:hypothetical protein
LSDGAVTKGAKMANSAKKSARTKAKKYVPDLSHWQSPSEPKIEPQPQPQPQSQPEVVLEVPVTSNPAVHQPLLLSQPIVEPPKPGSTESAALIARYGNKSNAIRELRKLGWEFATIAGELGIRYQHVRNVLNQPMKRLIKAEREAAKKDKV